MDRVMPIEQLGLQVSFSPDQRKYFDKLKAELLALFNGRTYEELLASAEAAQLKKIADRLAEMQRLVETKKMPVWDREQFIDWMLEFHVGKNQPEVEAWLDENIIFKSEKIVTRRAWNLSKQSIDSLPDNLFVAGDFDLIECRNLEALPENLTVKGGLFVANCLKLSRAGTGLRIGGVFFAVNCQSLNSLPDNLDVGGDMWLTACGALTALPNKMFVGGNLEASGTGLQDLPDDLVVEGDLNIAGVAKKVYQKAKKLKALGQIKGEIKYDR